MMIVIVALKAVPVALVTGVILSGRGYLVFFLRVVTLELVVRSHWHRYTSLKNISEAYASDFLYSSSQPKKIVQVPSHSLRASAHLTC